VADLQTDPWGLAVTPDQFAEHIEVLRQRTQPLSLQQLICRLDRDDLPRIAVAVTFDDGYVDNLLNAKPLLERYDIPATIFLTSGAIGQTREFWWDDLDRLLLQQGTLSKTLEIFLDGQRHRWDLGDVAHYDEATAALHRDWRAWEPPPTPRHLAYRSLWELLQPLSPDKIIKVLDELLISAGAVPTGRPTHRAITAEEAVALTDGGLIDVGAHTVTHPMLGALPADRQRDELVRSKRDLEDILGRPVPGFAYPYGGPTEYSTETVAITREAGFDYACSNVEGLLRRSTDRFQLPRYQVHGQDGDELASLLSGW
jgi:peptidoglycan/xylan/chitin deacetylase (PgdA/CDA1 family)